MSKDSYKIKYHDEGEDETVKGVKEFKQDGYGWLAFMDEDDVVIHTAQASLIRSVSLSSEQENT